ncbi:MAG: GNAT family N-acetyltransferase [Rhizobiales bacterium]|nr:GNAT family N-acetyltransferase [Hyphomicrobiales bacterium]
MTTLAKLLDVLIPRAGFGRVVSSDGVDALALAVVDADLVGLFEVMTAPERRRQGLARALTAGLLRWGRTQCASIGWLAVAAANLPAVRLYESLGFREVYRYHYRSTS